MAVTEAPTSGDSLVECALKVLNCPDPWKKAEYTYAVVNMWRSGAIQRVRPVAWQHLRAPDRPARSDDKVRVCTPGEAPRRGKGGSLASRQALLHSAVHIENWAVDLSWDCVARFGLRADEYLLPRAFFDDFVTVAEDECRHFSALAKRLEEIGSHYGALAVHDGLWESAAGTSHCLPARLAVEHCVHEARGLDVLPATIAKFANNGDAESAALLRDVVYPEEVNHCAAGVRWIRYLYDVAHGKRPPAPPADEPASASASADGGAACSETAAGREAQSLGLEALSLEGREGCSAGAGDRDSTAASSGPGQAPQQGSGGGGDGGCDGASGCSGGGDGGGGGGGTAASPSWMEDARRFRSVEEWFHSLVRSHFWGTLKPPFNEEARAKAGFGPEWYLPLATPAAPAAGVSEAAAPQTQTQIGPSVGPEAEAQAAAAD